MIGPEELIFHIDAFSPETIPMGRLAEYMAELSRLLGQHESVHFVRLAPGSTCIVHKIEAEAVPKVRLRTDLAGTPNAPEDVRKAYAALNELLRDDNAIGTLKRQENNVIRFPGREIPRPQKLGPFVQPTEVDGVLVRIGGRDSTAHALIQDAEGRTWPCTVTREIAREMAHHLFGSPLRVTGSGRWERNDEGEWELRSFTGRNFEVLTDESFGSLIEKLRKAEGADWASDPDPVKLLKEMRGDDEGIH